tara:strand:- start:261 stop:1499 length:1239 start_codon:yes stop_codon:yes gene_type:complete
MAVNKGLKSLAESTPNFSNQALENAINNLKIGWVAKSIQLDTAIEDSTVLTSSQKNDLRDDIDNVPHLNIGRYLGELVRHTNTIIDGSIIPGDPLILTGDQGQGSFIEILQLVQSLQSLIPELLGVTPAEKNRAVNDHLGSLNNIFLETEDSSQPVFTSLQEAIGFINNAGLATDTTYQTAIDDLKNFVVALTGDSTDFQTSLDNRATALATAQTNFNNALASEPYLTKRTQLVNNRESIVTQKNLESSNILSLRTFTEDLANNQAFTALAEDPSLRQLMARVAQNENWQNYFNDYEANQEQLNPIYTTDSDSDKSGVIDAVLASRGLPDVLDHTDLDAVAEKAKKDSRIDTKGFDLLFVENIITKCCEQLGLSTRGSIINQSRRLLNNLNTRDREIVALELDQNESNSTIS